MKLSVQEEYGLRCLVAIARKGPGASMTIPELSVHEGLTQPHIAKLMSVLRKSGFVTSSRGQIGGYALAREPKAIGLSELLSAMGGRLVDERFCERHSGNEDTCVHLHESCVFHRLWASVQDAVDGVLGALTLQDVLDDRIGPRTNVAFQELVR